MDNDCDSILYSTASSLIDRQYYDLRNNISIIEYAMLIIKLNLCQYYISLK